MKNKQGHTLLRLIKVAVGSVFFVGAWALNILRRLAGKKPPAVCVVLHYHEVSPKQRKRFCEQMDALLLRAVPIAAGSREPLQRGRRYAAVTFDDGFASTIENAVPELVQRKIPATLFIVAGLLGAKPNWLTLGADCLDAERIAPAERLKELPSDLITIGSHTLSHPRLPSLPEVEAMTELAASRESLERVLNRNIKLFSFPYGAHNERLIKMCREAGYERVFTIVPTLAFTDPMEYETGRVRTDPTDWPLEFHLKLMGAYRWLPLAISWKRKLLAKV